MTISTTEPGTNLGEAEVRPSYSSPSVDLTNVDALCSLMKMYESGQVLDQEESEVDLMIQLSGMVPSDTRTAE
jgi:hypothetical protein